MADAYIEEITADGGTVLFVEYACKIKFVYEVALGEIVERYFFGVMLVEIAVQICEQCALGTMVGDCIITDRMPAVGHEQG